MARRTFDTILNHFSFVHAPTFRIVDTAACLAFAICTVGGIRPSKPKWEWEYEQLMQGPPPVNKSDPKRMDGAVQPERSWESMYKANYENPGDNEDEEIQNANKWANGTIVRNDKQNMLVKVGSDSCFSDQLLTTCTVLFPRPRCPHDRI